MKRRKAAILYLLATIAVTLGVVAILRISKPKINLPYSDRFGSNHAEEWAVYGGSWRLKDGAVVNRSDERGAKIITGEDDWDNYSITTDMILLGHGGDVGVLVRVNDPEKGINAYRGYYVGMRSQDQALIMGIANYDWIEARPVPVHGGVNHLTWYRLQVVAVGCEIAADLENLQTHDHTRGVMNAAPCFTKGKVGLRSLNSGSAYRNLHVVPAGPVELAHMLSQAPTPFQDRYPFREADYAHMKLSYYRTPELLLDSLLGPVRNAAKEKPMTTVPLESIHSLQTVSRSEIVRIQGVVTLTDPLYVQDRSGGILVQMPSPNILNAGDEVEMVGRLRAGRKAPFEVISYRLLWESSLIPPASISSTQAASGAFDGSLVELSGALRSWKETKDGTLMLEIEDMAQRFAAVVPRGLSDAAPTFWQAGSTVRVRGVCTSGVLDSSESAFQVLLRDANDVEYLSPPQWNQGIRLIILITAGGLVVIFWTVAYLRGEHRRMRTIMQERELLAAEMHDTLAQSFAGVGYHLQSIRRGMQLEGSLSEKLMRKVDVACAMAVTAHRDASERIASLRYRQQQNGDLLDQLHQSAVTMLNGAHIGIELQRRGRPVRLSAEVNDALRGIGEEAVANILRHSQAREMRLSLNFGRSAVEMCIEDDGVGFDCLSTPAGFGQKGMELRARQIKGALKISSSPGRGSMVTVSLPYRRVTRFFSCFTRTREHCAEDSPE